MNLALLQTGIGIDIEAGNLTAVCVKRQLNRCRVLDRVEIPNYRAAGSAECHRLYSAFLKRNGLRIPWTVVALPRSMVLMRWLSFPAAVEKELAAAVQFQLESLHPFEPDAIYWDYAAWKRPRRAFKDAAVGTERIEVAVAIAEKKYIDETATWFQGAGIGVSQFTVTTTALLGAVAPRVHTGGSPDPRGSAAFFVLDARADAVQLIGHAPGSLVSKEIHTTDTGEDLAAVRRELQLARSELRVDPEERVPLVLCGGNAAVISEAVADMTFDTRAIETLFPFMRSAPEDHCSDQDAVAVTAAFSAADRSLPYSLNLLPPEKRSYQSGMIYAPAYALAGIILLLLIAVGVRGSYQDWRYQKFIEQQIQSLQPQLSAVEEAEQHSRQAYERLTLLEQTRKTATLPLEVLGELTRLLPDDAWVQGLQYDGTTVSLSGYAKSASPLLETLAASPYFESPQFLSAISKSGDGKELFRIGVRVRKGR
ncbi:MAG: PilN domain-containing protein [Acidobacteria bacterium]|nr:PilN domain-containing protein [Acidobacteriota bacterium]